jgi:hypothetical protein
MSVRSPQSPVAEPTPYEVLSIDEIMDRFAGEWIMMRVTEHDEGWPARGYVTIRAATQNAMLVEMERQSDVPELARFPRYSFLAEPDLYIDDPAELHRLMCEEIEADRADCV